MQVSLDCILRSAAAEDSWLKGFKDAIEKLHHEGISVGLSNRVRPTSVRPQCVCVCVHLFKTQ